MIAECLILGSSVALAKDAVTIEYLKSKQLELSEEEKQEFASDKDRRFIHFTSKENAEKIMNAGFLIPTKGMLENHFTKSIDSNGKKKSSDMVYMFDSKTFSVDDYIRNLPKDKSPFGGCYEYYAVSMRPDEHEINNFKRRAQDSAITYEGRLDIEGTDSKLAKYILTLNDKGEYEFNEVPMDYKYEPSQELLDKLQHDKMGMLKYTLNTYMSEVKRAKTSFKRYKAQKELYKEQIAKKKEFAKANRQFKEEEKDKSYVFKKDGRTIVVKNVEYEEVGGKKLQRLAILENSEETKNKKVKDIAKYCYMDEFNIEDMDKDVATQYFFNNLDSIKEKGSTVPEYIGLPLENLETGEVVNEYDTTFDKTFKEYMDRRQKTLEKVEPKYDDMLNKRKFGYKIKEMFSKIFGRKKDVKLLNEKNQTKTYEQQEKEDLRKLGYESVEDMNRDDREAEMFKFLQDNTYPPEENAMNYINSNNNEKNMKEKNLEQEKEI